MRLKWLVLVMVFGFAGCAPRVLAPTAAPTRALLPLPASPGPRAGTPPVATRAATPVIIASPTPSATPVTHVVTEGETLLSIAYDYGVSLETLQAANPTVQARFLSVGTVLVIPPPEGGAAISATHLAPPPPAGVELSDPACYATPTGALLCFVEARNPTEASIENISARVTLAGADGLPLAEQVAYAALSRVAPGGSAPLLAAFEPAPATPVAATAVEVLTADQVSESIPGAFPLPVDDLQATAVSEGRLSVTGQVRNATEAAASQAAVVLTLYDEAGAIVGFRRLVLAGPLAPGEARGFTLAADSLSGAFASYTLAVEGRP